MESVALFHFAECTNVISELNKPEPNLNVIRWLNQHPTAFISTITKAELLYGVANLSDGKRKRQPSQATDEILALFENHTLSFCTKSAEHYAKVISDRQKQGRPILMADALIASIALANGLTVVPRNIKDFDGIDKLALFNPFNP
ncbi:MULTISPECIES: type II toxin-antitoxin system VapC family toxin [Moraxella]|jgi:pilT protein domain protein|uniref:PIN domain-containing protein n=1 Tax=Moraxella lacunata TaxID=477 RepID=A0A1B8Q2H7_MORLA|nr:MULTISPECIES: type II toxin-antitoxin system VapC family toxin [Moraxella]MBE9577965.1 type II toxin-antitoxin system VapC family toxin [Moraxella sp. K1664]MBE9587468.1 type II toxin-antitoxin system VapC family toxin [Moraxella sp. K1630]MBE9590633.1 type II toxin-antitoxin system VapC family toxin [Moraxella sp. K127]MBE9595626.1 type II toxin-antitoxin system VapC family toxin [Moraxella sp. K2450]MDH9218441.1 type II toxin-antitoxin system VapC family toxin [Moraxella lacunata]